MICVIATIETAPGRRNELLAIFRGLVPKVRAALAGITAPGAEAVICDASAPGALARALDDATFGTRITRTAA